LRNQARQTKPE
jgi:hypothetical protein